MDLALCPQGCTPAVEGHKTTLALETDSRGRPQYVCICCYWRGQTSSKREWNPDFIYNSIAKYNKSSRRTQQDAILHAVGLHCGLIKPKRNQRLPILLSQEERDRVLYFLRQFLASQKLDVKIKE
jgi:hypothetical protein